MSKTKVVIAGGTGFVGRHLVEELANAGYDCVVLSRDGKAPAGAQAVTWNSDAGPWANELEGACAVVNLTGEPIDQKWTEEAKKKILDSRLESTSAIAEAIAKAKTPPEAWINASAIGIYGDMGDRSLSEASQPGEGFLAEVATKWEAAVTLPEHSSVRRVIVRFGMILGEDGGALPRLAKLARLGLGGAIGSGEQYMSWIHIDDLVRMIRWAIEDDSVTGVLNGVSPAPMRNADFMAELRKVYSRPPIPAVPAPVFRMVSSLMGVPAELVLGSQRVYPTIPTANGFVFDYPTLSIALPNLLEEHPPTWATGQG